MWTLTFALEETQHPSFEAAFGRLKELWEEKGGSPQMLETIWITPYKGQPMFYNKICEYADRLDLP